MAERMRRGVHVELQLYNIPGNGILGEKKFEENDGLF